MTRIHCILAVFLVISKQPTDGKVVSFAVKPNETVRKVIDLKQETDSSSPFRSRFLAVQTSSAVSIHVSGCSRIPLLESIEDVEVQIPEDTWKCAKKDEKIVFDVESMGEEATGSLRIYSIRPILKSASSRNPQETNRFHVSENNPFFRRIKLESLADDVEIKLTSENVENALDVYISFCAGSKGILYTSSYAPNVDISLRSPRMELYYDAYSCDSNISFYTNSSQPVSPLIIRLESQFAINGSLRVLINGEEPATESHVAHYETGSYDVRKGETKEVELKYRPNFERLHAFFDVISGSVSASISPCKSNPFDVAIGDFAVGSHRIDIDVEHLMANTSCSLLQIDPSIVFLSLHSPSQPCSLSLWIPGDKATWHLAILIGLLLVLLTAIMLLIIHLGRRKTGKLVINYFQSS